MALALGDAAASRATLADAIERLKRQYAGGGQQQTAAQVAAYMQANPGQTNQFETVQGWLPQMAALQAQAAGINGAPAPARASSGPYDLAGDGGAWAPNGQNSYNSMLARGDMAMPAEWGGVGVLDLNGTPFWRRDFDPKRPGHILGDSD